MLTLIMWSNYLKVAFRQLTRNKIFSLINISGLSLGMTCSILILLWNLDEVSIDSFHKNNDRLYGVYERVFWEGKVEATPFTPGMLADDLKLNIVYIQYPSTF